MNELWFNVHGHLMRFDLQEYAIVTGLRCGLFREGDDFNRLIERKKLKERYFKSDDKISLAQLQSTVARLSTTCTDSYKLGLVLIVLSVSIHRHYRWSTTWTSFFPTLGVELDIGDCCKGSGVALQENSKRPRGGRRKRLHARCMAFPLPCRFGHMRRFRRLGNASVSESVNECHDFFAGPHKSSHITLRMYATLRPIDAEAKQPYFSTLVPYDNPPVLVLDDIVRTVLAPQFHSLHTDSGIGGQSESDEQSGSDRDGDDSEDRDGDNNEDTGESSTPSVAPIPSPVRGSTTHTRLIRTSISSLTRGDVEELLLDQRILYEMQLRTVKLEIQQHVTFECTRLREFTTVLVAPPAPTIAPCSTGAIVEPNLSGSSLQDVHRRGTDPLPTPIEMGVDTGRSQPPDGAYSLPCTDEEELLVGTEDLPVFSTKGADIAPGPDAKHELWPTPIDDPQDGAATEPSQASGVSDAEFDGCNVTDGKGKFIACVTSVYVTSA
ncbi:Hypothetical predicted protein [Olea europaea subsp. europaea]|uniref:DUF1985 domain-containing protein n=1 Tax=Olea europaea subsp. europaea TaxID=158383 RepID=A0A8S0Q1V5_OLEEU|nr:Hypothetical predicted protein [Olea europaea subsp. europaea]